MEAEVTVTPMIAVTNLTKTYGTTTAVTHLSFAVAPGEIVGLIGPNGAGKTSTLRCLVGIQRADRGLGHDRRPRHRPRDRSKPSASSRSCPTSRTCSST